MNITKFIKDRIIEKYGSIRKFANKVGIPTSTLTTALNKERGFNTMPVEKALIICKELGITVESVYNAKLKPLSTDEVNLLNNFRSVSNAGKNLIMNHIDLVKDYESTIEEPQPNSKFLIAASGAEDASDEEIQEAIKIAKDLR